MRMVRRMHGSRMAFRAWLLLSHLMNTCCPIPVGDLVRSVGRLALRPRPSPRCRNLLVLLASLCLAAELRCQSNYANPYTFTTLAGHAGDGGYVDGTGDSARFKEPKGVAVDTSGNLYVLDTGSETIRKVSPAGVVTSFSGVPLNLQPPNTTFPLPGPVDGDATTAAFQGLTGICIDKNGNLYVTDGGYVREVSPTEWSQPSPAGASQSQEVLEMARDGRRASPIPWVLRWTPAESCTWPTPETTSSER